jgi:hypothetical protein
MSDPKKRLTLEELEATEEYLRLTPKQRMFVATYCTGGRDTGNYDPVSATLTAYKCKSPEVARIMSYSVMANIRIVAALNRYFAKEPIEEFLLLLDRAINNKKLTMAQLGALKLRCDVLGLVNRLPSNAKVLRPNVLADAQEKPPKNITPKVNTPSKKPKETNFKF